MPNAIIDLNIVINGKSILEGLSEIVATLNLPYSCFYDPSGQLCTISENVSFPGNSLLEFRVDANGNITDCRKPIIDDASSEGRDYRAFLTKLTSDLDGVMKGEWDASGAEPFTSEQYSSHTKKFSSFGEFALKRFIVQVIGDINVELGGGGNESVIHNVNNIVNSSLLVNSLLELDNSQLLQIAQQVLNQDPNRYGSSIPTDNTGKWHPLILKAGDIIYFYANLAGSRSYCSANTYKLKVTLREPLQGDAEFSL